ncbi:hypothetical protein COX00_01895 [Candidatus Uhrbacteria bacterium CG22_combo_CG10-13_8_21_14_all_47_17]|uniref:Uncharacterized protein n=1 Tax=Candidatus Uhrbacteria bacterium CG22_combo_CG10-13_8_21_14_all_47_17 TaxID=1975041 RepID=A0A2H0BSP6_9BACT|nr:MAG: hypothetical protein COX00_01895 [Candidatus Uhrbacteria bacterium CG22_combo_CG10-13_8_21_14_all_47_17]
MIMPCTYNVSIVMPRIFNCEVAPCPLLEEPVSRTRTKYASEASLVHGKLVKTKRAWFGAKSFQGSEDL